MVAIAAAVGRVALAVGAVPPTNCDVEYYESPAAIVSVLHLVPQHYVGMLGMRTRQRRVQCPNYSNAVDISPVATGT